MSSPISRGDQSNAPSGTPQIRKLGLFSIVMISIGSMVGSGWLFGAYRAAQLAGPGAIFSWIIGGTAALMTALTYMEVATLFPETGGPIKYLEKTHGSVVGFLAAWAIWLSFVAVIPIEAEASVQYMSSWPWHWILPLTSHLYNANSDVLSLLGLGIATILMLIFLMLNYWSVTLFVRSVNAITLFKLLVPALTITLIVLAGFHKENFTSVHQTLIPYGMAGVFTAVATSGIIFAFNGFQAALFFAGEAKKPSVNLPLSLIISIAFCVLLYIGLQIAFIGGVAPDFLAAHGWQFTMSSPFAQLAVALGLNFLMLLLYIDAFISPSGTGIAYMGATARQLLGMSVNGYMFRSCQKLDPVHQVPRNALLINFFIGLLLLYLFRSWSQLAGVLSVATILSFMSGPIALGALRQLKPDLKRPFRLVGGHILSPIAFMIAAEMFYWSTWPLTGKVVLVFVFGFALFIFFQSKKGWDGFGRHLKAGWWLICFFGVMTLLSYVGSRRFDGLNLIPFGWDMLVSALVSLIFYYWGIKSAWVTPALKDSIEKSSIVEKPILEK